MKPVNILSYLDAAAASYPAKPAFISEVSAISFSGLKHHSEVIGSFIANKNIYSEPILIFMEKSPEEVSAFLGVIASGNFYVALDLEMPQSRLSHIFSITEAGLMICDKYTEEKAKSLGFKGEIYNYEETVKGEADKERLLNIRQKAVDTDSLYLTFTSGSTGEPKGVMANHRNVIDYIEGLGEILDCDETTIFGNQAPLYLDASLKDIYTNLKYGATTYFIPGKLFMAPVKLINYLNKHKINTICFTASALTIFTKLSAFDYAIPESLKVIASGGEVLQLSHLKRWREACPEAKFINLYGATECTGMSSFYVIEDMESIKNSIPLGKPFPDTEIFLLDENNKRVENGGKGEICIGGTGVTRGYYKDDGRTVEKFVQNPLNEEKKELIYKTGDIGYIDENGDLYFVGRKDNQIKHMGYRIEPEEIEACGSLCAGVIQGVCIYDNDKSIIKYIYEGKTDEAEVRKYFKMNLATYMVPRKIIKSDKLPVMSGGKIDRKRLGHE